MLRPASSVGSNPMSNVIDPQAVEWQPCVRVIATSVGANPTTLKPGRDLTLSVARRDGDALPQGVLLDDSLQADARQCIDEEAVARFQTWRKLREVALVIDGVSLPHIWEL